MCLWLEWKFEKENTQVDRRMNAQKVKSWGKPRGFKTSEETKAKISAGVKKAYKKYVREQRAKERVEKKEEKDA